MPATELTDVPAEGMIPADIMAACKPAKSRSEAKRLVEQGGVFVNREKTEDVYTLISCDSLKQSLKIRKGKKVFHKVFIG